MGEAKSDYGEALAIHRRFAESIPDTYLPDLAATLSARVRESGEVKPSATSVRLGEPPASEW